MSLTLNTEGLYVPHPLTRTHSGIYMNCLEPTADMIDINDIAHALSRQPRWAGHTDREYSVAQHSLHCAERVAVDNKLAALLHDASEAYLIDVPSPVKSLMPQYKEIENNLMQVIAEKFGFQYPLRDEIKEVDKYMLEREWHELVIKERVVYFLPKFSSLEAKEKFLKTFHYLTNNKFL